MERNPRDNNDSKFSTGYRPQAPQSSPSKRTETKEIKNPNQGKEQPKPKQEERERTKEKNHLVGKDKGPHSLIGKGIQKPEAPFAMGRAQPQNKQIIARLVMFITLIEIIKKTQIPQ